MAEDILEETFRKTQEKFKERMQTQEWREIVGGDDPRVVDMLIKKQLSPEMKEEIEEKRENLVLAYRNIVDCICCQSRFWSEY